MDSDPKFFISWIGTDKSGNYMLSHTKRLSRFSMYSVQNIFERAKTLVTGWSSQYSYFYWFHFIYFGYSVFSIGFDRKEVRIDFPSSKLKYKNIKYKCSLLIAIQTFYMNNLSFFDLS